MRKIPLSRTSNYFFLLFFAYVVSGCSKSSTPKPVDNNPGLTITSLSVNSGHYTTSVTIIGTGFSSTPAGDKVYFNGVEATVIDGNSTGLLTSVPLSAGTGPVTITVNGKTAIGPTFTYQLGEVVTLLAGSGNTGSANGMGAAASFSQTVALAADASGNIYVADQDNHLIRKITPAGLVSTFAGNGTTGSLDGTGTAASFSAPAGIATDAAGNVYVADKASGLIRKITPVGVVTTLTVDGSGAQVPYGSPYYLVLDLNGNIYFTDLGGQVMRKLTPTGDVLTIYTTGSLSSGVYGLAFDNAGDFYYIDESVNQIDKINFISGTTAFAGNGNIIGGAIDGTGNHSSFYEPWGMTIDGTGNLFVLDRGNGLIRKVTPAAVVTTFAGQNPLNYYGPAMSANLAGLEGITVDASGNLYVADGRTIRKISVQ